MAENCYEIWDKAKELLKKETTIITYETWIQPLEMKSIKDNNVILIASSTFQRDTVVSRYLDLLTNTFNFLTNKKCNVKIKLKAELEETPDIESTKEFVNSGLNPKYTFSTFVVGNNNKFAQAAASSIVDNPGARYNPFLIYGGVGLGKTHLMQAIRKPDFNY